MRVQIILDLEVPDDTEHEDWRNEATNRMGEIEGLHIAAAQSSKLETAFRVVGTTRGAPDKRWEETVDAQSPEQAMEKAAAMNGEGKRVAVDVQVAGGGAPQIDRESWVVTRNYNPADLAGELVLEDKGIEGLDLTGCVLAPALDGERILTWTLIPTVPPAD